MISLSPPTICNSAENTWSGTGRRPTWLKELLDSGLSLDDLKI
ncbi:MULTISPECIES: H-NS family nucleoid-associated regulatory protein [Enterobacteriaceae]|nr:MULTISPECIES: H-NS family nucleoid-associated regulatory protein [Enterobacteriaceae]